MNWWVTYSPRPAQPGVRVSVGGIRSYPLPQGPIDAATQAFWDRYKPVRLTPWFSMGTAPTRTGWYDVIGKSMSGIKWPNRMWYDADSDRWRREQFGNTIYSPVGPWFMGCRWRGRLK